MRVDLFDFVLPEKLIAIRPVYPRDSSRLLKICPQSTTYENYCVYDLPSLLRSGDVMVLNDVRVFPARLRGVCIRGDQKRVVEVMLHTRCSSNSWKAFVRPSKKVAAGDVIFFADDPLTLPHSIQAQVYEKYDSRDVLLRFDLDGAVLDDVLRSIGTIPLPPYIASKRSIDSRDVSDYQTVYAQKEEGAVAAPTAGLHFTSDLLDSLKKKGISFVFVTLNVGAGTFLPVHAAETSAHKMHPEKGYISDSVADYLNKARQEGRRIISVGTTSLRLLESAASCEGTIRPFSGETDIFITPGYQFKTCDILMTNFHLPRSTLFMLVSAFSGIETMQSAYRYAIESGYRFYSYGDSCLLFRSCNP